MTIVVKVLDDQVLDFDSSLYAKVSRQIDAASLMGGVFTYEKVDRYLKWYLTFEDEATYAIWDPQQMIRLNIIRLPEDPDTPPMHRNWAPVDAMGSKIIRLGYQYVMDDEWIYMLFDSEDDAALFKLTHL